MNTTIPLGALEPLDDGESHPPETTALADDTGRSSSSKGHVPKTPYESRSIETIQAWAPDFWNQSDEDLLRTWTVPEHEGDSVELEELSPPSSQSVVPAFQAAIKAEAPGGHKSLKSKKSSFRIKSEQKTAFIHFWRIFTYSTWTDQILLVTATIAALATGVTMPIMNVVFGRVFQKLSSHAQGGSVAEAQVSFMEGINQCVMYLVYIFIARLILEYISYLGFRMSSLRISAAMRLEYMTNLFQQPVSVLDSLPPGQTAAIITITASILQMGISEKLGQFVQAVSLILSSLIIAFLYSWDLTLVTGSGLVLIVLVYTITTPIMVRIMNAVQEADIKASTIASEIFSSIRMVSACGAQHKMAERYNRWVIESQRRGLAMSPVAAVQQAPG